MGTPEQARAWNRAHPERRAENERQYRQRHPETNRKYKQNMRVRAVEALGGKCSQCGYSDMRALEIDHIKNGGGKDREIRSRHSMFASIIKGTSVGEFQVLCANCHQIKSYEEVWKKYGAEWAALRGKKGHS